MLKSGITVDEDVITYGLSLLTEDLINELITGLSICRSIAMDELINSNRSGFTSLKASTCLTE